MGPVIETMDADLLSHGISEKDLEIEHLVIQLMANQQRVEVVEDLEADMQKCRELYEDSETRREALQKELSSAANKLRQYAEEGLRSEDKLIAENEKLRREMEKLRAQIGQKEKEHLMVMENERKAHKQEYEAVKQDKFLTIKAIENKTKAEIDRLVKENKQKIEEVLKETGAKISENTQEKDKKVAEAKAECA